MTWDTILTGLAGVVAMATPVVFATLGETLTERAGVINLSVNGTILLAAMGGFAAALTTDNLWLGFGVGMLIGGVVAALLAFTSLSLKQSQIAVGFVLALLTRDLAYYLGNPFVGKQGPRVPVMTLPGLSRIPVLGALLFDHDPLTYLSIVLIFVTWFWVYKTRPGLILQGLGERPAAAYARGANVRLQRYVYTILGGMLVGLAGPTYSLSVKAGWKGTISGLDGIGWIALALTIFGAWNPLRGAVGAYLFALLQWLSLVVQPYLPDVPTQVLQVAPFPLMILTLLLVNIGNTEWMKRTLAGLPPDARHTVARILRAMQVTPPAGLGRAFEEE